MRSKELLAEAATALPWIREIRRTIHRSPELGRQEEATAAYIESKLDELGVPHERKGTAVIGLIRGEGSGGSCVALRADIDALPVTEDTGLDFASEKPGLMHACGHDAHAAILLGAARLLAARRPSLQGAVKLFFQPDEEGEGGAEDIIKAGGMENPRADATFGLHVMPYLDPGQVETKKGALNGSSSTLKIIIRGKGGHGAYPEKCVDAILIAAQVVSALNTLVARIVSPLEQAVLTIGTIEGGTRSNIVAEEVRMSATLRSTDQAVRDLLVDRARAVVEGIAASFGGSGSLEVRHGYIALVNHAAEVDLLVEAASELLGPESIQWKEKPSMGVEDFSFYIKDRPGAFYHLGCGTGPVDERAPLHSPRFRLDESCLPIGAALQAEIALRYLEGRMGRR